MSYIFVVDEDNLTEEGWNKFISGENCLFLNKKRISRAFKMDLEEYCLDYADRLCNENIDRLNKLSISERKEVFCLDPSSSPNILYTYKPSEVKKSLDDYEKRPKVGDVVLFPFYGDIVKGLVTRCGKASTDNYEIVHIIQKNGETNLCMPEDCEKTGEHYDSIDEFMKGE